MATRSSVIRVEPDLAAAFNAAPERERERIKAAMRSLLRLVPARPAPAPHLSKRESNLFLRINRSLSERQRQRLDELNEKIEESSLTDDEHAELVRLTKLVERVWVERLQAIIALAKLRKIPPEEMMRQLRVGPLPDGSQ